MTPAQALTNQIRADVSKTGARLFPMVVGKFWGPYHRGRRVTKTETVTLNPGDVVIRNGHMVSIGQQGMSDLVGWTPYTVTIDDIGRVLAIYTACEVKAGADQLRPGQQEFIDAVNKSGGRAGVARAAGDAIAILRGE